MLGAKDKNTENKALPPLHPSSNGEDYNYLRFYRQQNIVTKCSALMTRSLPPLSRSNVGFRSLCFAKVSSLSRIAVEMTLKLTDVFLCNVLRLPSVPFLLCTLFWGHLYHLGVLSVSGKGVDVCCVATSSIWFVLTFYLVSALENCSPSDDNPFCLLGRRPDF